MALGPSPNFFNRSILPPGTLVAKYCSISVQLEILSRELDDLNFLEHTCHPHLSKSRSQISLFTFYKVLGKDVAFAQNSPKFNFVILVKPTNSSPFSFLCVRLIYCCIYPNICYVNSTKDRFPLNLSISKRKKVAVPSCI